MSKEVVIVEGVRTPFVKSGAVLKDVHSVDLGVAALKTLLSQTELDPSEIDEVIVGNVGSPSDSANIARLIAIKAGVPVSVPACTVQRNCASGLESITSGYEKIRSGTMDVVIAGGAESMSQVPLLHTKEFQDIFTNLVQAKTITKKLLALSKLKFKDLKPRIALVEGLYDRLEGLNMGQMCEILAKEFSISREEQDEFSVRSHHRAIRATQSGRFKKEITPVFLPPNFKKIIEDDVGPREGQSIEKLAKLKPYFDRKHGSVTVGNSCPITDGAAMILLMSEEKAKILGMQPLCRIKSYAYAGLDPKRMGLGPVFSTPIALKRAGLSLSDMGLIEINEAFAGQVLACLRAFQSDEFAQKKLGLTKAVGEIDLERLNVNGGAIALGHPVGVSGTRITLTLMKEMKEQSQQFGLATLCIGGGQGGAIVIENI